MRHDAHVVTVLLRRGATRARLLGAATGAAVALAVGSASIAAGLGNSWESRLSICLAYGLAGAFLGATGATANGRDVAQLIERREPACRNLLITAAELLDGRISAPAAITNRILQDADALSARLDLSRLFPSKHRILTGLAALAVAAAALVATSMTSPTTGAAAVEHLSPAISDVIAVVTPPSYAGQPTQTLRNPSRIEALAGSTIAISVSAEADRVSVETIAGTRSADLVDRQTFTATLPADADGFIALAPIAGGAAGVRRLIGLSVVPDRAPTIRITAPGRDLVLPQARQPLPIVIETDDDLGLASLKMTFTRIAGSGETFTFTNGEVPLAVTQSSGRTWTGRAEWRLDALKLEPGDMVIYRGVASDRRPGATPSESDTFIVEVTAPGALPSEGFAVDDRQDRYAISQQMVIVKTERLLVERGLSAEAFRERALDLAAEQRQVRAEFVFMMGGELADAGLDLSTLHEEEEAAGEEDIAAGRLANQGRLDLIRAIRSMSRAAARLADADVRSALPVEKEALSFLQRAFTRSRYILRALTERERIDLSRRLTGVLAALSRDRRPAAAATLPARIAGIRRLLADVAALAADPTRNTEVGAVRSALIAQQLLQLDPSSEPLRDAATALSAAAQAGANRPGAVQAALDRAALTLTTMARASLADDPAFPPRPELAELAGALSDALRRQGSSR